MGITLGKNSAKNTIRNTIESVVKATLSSSASCITTVQGSNILIIEGSNGIDISNISQKVFIKVNTSCAISQLNSTDIQQSITDNFKQSAETIAVGLSLNENESANLSENMQRLTSVVTNTLSAMFQSTSSAINSITIRDSSNVSIKYYEQESYIETTAEATIKQVMASETGQEVEVIIDQAAKTTVLNIEMLVIIITAGIVASVFIIFGSRYLTKSQAMVSSALKSPMLWIGLLSLPLMFTGIVFLLSLTPYKVVWPLKQPKTTDNEAEAKDKKVCNTAMSIITGTGSAALTAAIAGLGFYAYKSASTASKLRVQPAVLPSFW